MSDCVEFDCEGCGGHIYSVGMARVPDDGFCGACGMLNSTLGQTLDLGEFWEMYRVLLRNRGYERKARGLRPWMRRRLKRAKG